MLLPDVLLDSVHLVGSLHVDNNLLIADREFVLTAERIGLEANILSTVNSAGTKAVALLVLVIHLLGLFIYYLCHVYISLSLDFKVTATFSCQITQTLCR